MVLFRNLIGCSAPNIHVLFPSTSVNNCLKLLLLKVGNSLVDNGVTNPKCGDRHNLDAGTTTIKCIPVMSGRYLVMQSQLTEPMNFCEVEVYCEQIEHSD